MTFSNGDKLDADDVAWSINQLKEKQYYNANQVASLDKAEAVDANTVRLTLRCPRLQSAVVSDRTSWLRVR